MATCKDCLHNEICKTISVFISIKTGDDADKMCGNFTDKSRFIELDENLESILICAERYACGRRTYMPSIVVDYIELLVPKLSTKTLVVIGNDLSTADKTNNLGHPQIDAPLWLDLYKAITEELKKRNTK